MLFNSLEISLWGMLTDSAKAILAHRPDIHLLPDIVEAAEKKKKKMSLCVVMNEVNIMFPGKLNDGSKLSTRSAQNMVRALELLTAMAKQSNEMNVLQTTSEHGYSHRLNLLGFQPEQLHRDDLRR